MGGKSPYELLTEYLTHYTLLFDGNIGGNVSALSCPIINDIYSKISCPRIANLFPTKLSTACDSPLPHAHLHVWA